MGANSTTTFPTEHVPPGTPLCLVTNCPWGLSRLSIQNGKEIGDAIDLLEGGSESRMVVSATQVSEDNLVVVDIAGRRSEIFAVNVRNGQRRATLEHCGVVGSVSTVKFLPRNELLAACGTDGRIALWEKCEDASSSSGAAAAAAWPVSGLLVGHAVKTGALENPSAGVLVSGSHDETARIWDVSREECIGILSQGRDFPVTCLCSDVENQVVITGIRGGVRGWDLRTHKEVFDVGSTRPKQIVSSLWFRQKKAQFVVVHSPSDYGHARSGHGHVLQFDTRRLGSDNLSDAVVSMWHTPHHHGSFAHCVVVEDGPKDSPMVVTSGTNFDVGHRCNPYSWVKAWTENGKCLWDQHTSSVTELIPFLQGDPVARPSVLPSALSLQTFGVEVPSSTSDEKSAPPILREMAGAPLCLVGCSRSGIERNSLKTGQRIGKRIAANSLLSTVGAFDAVQIAENTIAAVGEARYVPTLFLYDLMNGEQTGELGKSDEESDAGLCTRQCSPKFLQFIPKSRILVAAGSKSSTVWMWRRDEIDVTFSFCGHWSISSSTPPSPITAVDVRTSLVVSGHEDGSVNMWDVSREECIGVLSGHTKEVSALCHDVDRQIQFTGSWDQTVIGWDVRTNERIVTLQIPDEIDSLCFRQTESQLVVPTPVLQLIDTRMLGDGDATSVVSEWNTGHYRGASACLSVSGETWGFLVTAGLEDPHMRAWRENGKCIWDWNGPGTHYEQVCVCVQGDPSDPRLLSSPQSNRLPQDESGSEDDKGVRQAKEEERSRLLRLMEEEGRRPTQDRQQLSSVPSAVISLQKLATIPWDEIKLGKRIGSGRFGLVHMANWQSAPVAVKLLNGDPAFGEDAIRKFGEEALLMSRLSHPSCLQMYGLSVWSREGARSQIAVVMELCDSSWKEFILRTYQEQRNRSVPFLLKLEQLVQVAQGMNYLHSIDIIHRDLKPENVLVKKNDCKIADFGVSKRISASCSDAKTGVGTGIYMAPEQTACVVGYDGKVDVFAYAITAFVILTENFHPYGLNEIPAQVAVQVSVNPDRRPPLADATFAFDEPELRQLIAECWSHEPADRPSFADIVDRLTALQRRIVESKKIWVYLFVEGEDVNDAIEGEILEKTRRELVRCARRLFGKDRMVSGLAVEVGVGEEAEFVPLRSDDDVVRLVHTDVVIQVGFW